MSAKEAATTTASTKRPPALSGGKVGAPATNLASLLIVPLMPVSAETANVTRLDSPRTSFETFAFPGADNINLDVVNGDLLVVGSTEYKIIAVAPWERPGEGSFLHLVVEKLKVSA